MTTSTPRPSSVPDGYTSVTPWMITPDTDALLGFVQRAFAAEPLARVVGASGAVEHAEFRIGDAIVLAFDAAPHWPPTPTFLRLFVADGDAVWRRAVSAGAEPLTHMVTQFWGDRTGRVRDAQGNVYWIQTRLEEPSPEEIQRRAAMPEYVEAMRYTQSTDLLSPRAPERAPGGPERAEPTADGRTPER